MAACALLGLAGIAAAGDTPSAPPAVPQIALEASKPVELDCRTKAVVVATDAANATTGQIRLSLLLKDASAKPPVGVWRIVRADGTHAGSFATREAKACGEACPLAVPAPDQIQLWSPAPKGVEQLKAGEMLLLAVLKTATLDLRATTFNGPQIEALEEGSCTRVP